MAFILDNTGRISSTQADTVVLHSYKSNTDTRAVILASDYFSRQSDIYGVGDWVMIKAADDTILGLVTQLTPTVELTAILGQASTFGTVSAAEFTTAGGSATESITNATVLATDLVLVQLKVKGATPVTILTAVAAAGQIDLEFSADPSTDHVLVYQVLRAF